MERNEDDYGEYEEEEEYSQPMVSTRRPYATILEAGHGGEYEYDISPHGINLPAPIRKTSGTAFLLVRFITVLANSIMKPMLSARAYDKE